MLYKLSADFSKLANDHVNSATQKEVLINKKKKLNKPNKQTRKHFCWLRISTKLTAIKINSFTTI